MKTTIKAIAFLKALADKPGHKLTAREAQALRLAATLIEQLEQRHELDMDVYRRQSSDLIDATAELDALRAGLQAVLEVTL